MRKIVVGIAAVILSVFVLQAGRTDEPAAPDTSEWEYRVIGVAEMTKLMDLGPGVDDALKDHSPRFQQVLNDEFGAKGWELCEMGQHWVFKRPKAAR